MKLKDFILVLKVNIILFLLIDIFTSATLIYVTGTQLSRLIFPLIVLSTQLLLHLTTEIALYQTNKQRIQVKVEK
jgi:hypothetical protein